MPDAAAGYAGRRAALSDALHRHPAPAAPLGLAKRTSNLFRDRGEGNKRRLDLSAFDHVLDVDPAQAAVEVEGLATYDDLVTATLPHGTMPAVVPQLKTITVGGALAGVGIEATSFRQGLVHDTLLALDVLLPGGDIVTATADNGYADLFHGFANSYGTLGYALRARLRTLPVKPYVRVEHRRHANPQQFFDDLAAACAGDSDFVDGVVFDAGCLVVSRAAFVDTAPATSDYTYRNIYYRSLRTLDVDCLTTHDYLWRWDTDWFWCSKNVGAQNPLLRRLYGRARLNSRTYTRIMRFNSRHGITRRLARLAGRHPESVIQDIDIPFANAGAFLAFLLREIGIVPIWTCPIRPARPDARFPLYPLVPGTAYVNFGFWDVVASREAHARGHYNRMIEREAARLGGIKSLYSDSYFTREEFAAAYDMPSYHALKAKYDPQQRALGLYEKCVLRA
ncbi:MAG TPA: FAD-binding oxidoreductase [Casimicrobiaceae bacterium]|nr:FAD-binding oxidoreductase [Casimicrobiaceae bacterium]